MMIKKDEPLSSLSYLSYSMFSPDAIECDTQSTLRHDRGRW